MADEQASTAALASEKKHKSHKKHKRHLENDGTESSERKHKKSKSSAHVPVIEPEVPTRIEPKASEVVETDGADKKTEKKKRRKHKSHATDNADEDQPAPTSAQDGATDVDTAKKEKKKSKSKDHKRKHEKAEVTETIIPYSQGDVPDPEAMDIDSAPAENDIFGPDEFGQKPADKAYPFFTQTVSQYLALFPSGLIEPVEGFADQHLRPLLKRYVPSFRGVLLAYRNPRVGEAPGKGSLTEESAPDDVVLLESINEYAVSFGWLTVDVDVFRPTRGAWMEGIVNLQGEGHIGVVCWDLFNASIEAGRLPHGWHWVDLLSKGKEKSKDKGKGRQSDREKTAEEAKLPTPDPFDDPNNELDNDTTQIHTTGYWVDENGTKVRGGAKLYFRIKHYEVGVSGDYGYLSIEGTMLNEEEEKAKYTKEMEVLRRRKQRHGGLLRKEQKRLPEFSMTKFGANEAEDNEAQRAPVQWVGSRPGSDTE
ncbi:uncharacterized protein F4807DRAFT_189033 [Annulohypoxylon truncatum]|uniref:uncharacterized protein n=1 Tax=Annulohypoxylon truncatum TaxID=327061 RepID=UPI0020081BB9|nr:uncharacterized protein F4807DRAFT_189033 [Annulohypoxylon truncatum]KAI1207152.1 hypothetical protein F4807DRAFT_189033 [Annulohypoxylon truncatum]